VLHWEETCVADVVVSYGEALVRRLVGTEIFRQGRELVDAGRVTGARWHAASGRAFGQVNDSRGPQTAMVMTDPDSTGAVQSLRSHCTCSGEQQCVHATAVLLAALSKSDEAETKPGRPGKPHRTALPRTNPTPEAAPPRVGWERSLASLLPPARRSTDEKPPQVAVQFELATAPGPRGSAIRTRIGLRPVLPGARGNWIRSGISWQNLGYIRYGQSEETVRQVRLLREIFSLYSSAHGFYAYGQGTPYLEAAPSRRIWDLLAEAQELGIPLVQHGKGDPPVTLHATPARAGLVVGRGPGGLDVTPQIVAPQGAAHGRQDEQLDLGSALLLGDPVHGVAWWQGNGGLQVAPLRGTIDTSFTKLLTSGPIQVPAEDETRFLRDYFPRLRERLEVTSSDPSVDLPEAQPPLLVLTVERLTGHRLSTTWSWSYALGEAKRTEPLWPEVPVDHSRDTEAEAEIVARASAAIEVAELFEHSPAGRRLAPTKALDGITTIRVLNAVLPVLSAMDGVEVVLSATDDAPDYREADEAPVITLTGDRARDDRDWFSLAVTVSVDGEEVPFDQLFVALAQEQPHLILASGTYFSLDRDEFRRLGALIVEARALQEVENGSVRLSRFQAGLWEELERIGTVSGQAKEWQQSVRALASATVRTEHPTPTGLHATLRPYQLAGFNWLAALYEYRLGGILADDMGLGKTLQALALFAHVRQQALSDRPFLVIAPTSVVFNWTTETERFTPALKVAAITETRARRGEGLDAAIAGADIVVTSYTLFRLEYADYEAVEWAGMVLDEAQFVKNHQSQAYQCAKKLSSPFKLAITGTPMENNLMELWSLLSITAPGLFANPAQFTEYYRTPIEKDHNTELLAQLRQRVKPLMLRRTKEQVASDLPDKQEQVIELELNPKHRKVYQTHLQRERQKVLGLLGDLQKNRFEIFRSLTLLRQASLDAALIDPKYAAVPSTKLDAMMEQVTDIVSEGHRTLIFSQFTRFLTSARNRLEAAGVEYCYLDGSTRDRSAVLKEFKAGSAPVFLISLKAGGFGLNLTEADYCILLDPWWNPATEAQAVDRVHRIGQTRKVMVYRLVARDTIEEKVMALKATKAALFDSVMDGGAFESGILDADDIRSLLA
jgi:superfamily II DNA or RNA helicase